MNDRQKLLRLFFDNYANHFNSALKGNCDVEATAKSFAACFVAANPAGVMCGNNDAQFRSSMLQGYLFYQNIGVTSMQIRFAQISPLDDFHDMVKIAWRCSYTRKDQSNGEIEFDNIYFTQTISGATRIFAYITGDEQAVLREHGLV